MALDGPRSIKTPRHGSLAVDDAAVELTAPLPSPRAGVAAPRLTLVGTPPDDSTGGQHTVAPRDARAWLSTARGIGWAMALAVPFWAAVAFWLLR